MIGGKIYAAKLLDDLQDITVELPVATEQAAVELALAITASARVRALGQGSVHAHVVSGIDTVSSGVELNVARFPMILGAEFGGGGRSTTRQFPPHRGSGGNAGYMLYPEVRRHEDEDKLDEIFGEKIDEVLD